MTEKRFTIEILDENNWLIEDTKTGLDYNPIDGTTRVLKGLVDLVNNLYKENEQLKSRVEYLERKIQRERRASTKQHLKWSKEAEEQIQILAEENEELKNNIKEAYRTERTAIGKSVLKQLLNKME